MNPCESNKKISSDLIDFIHNVSDIKEESITDYLAWKWRESDSKFNYININTFTREEENKLTGADFEMELWLVGKRSSIPLLIQAKKLIKNYDGYCNKLNYPNGSQGQLIKLLSYAKRKNRIPFYVFYSIPDKTTKFLCRGARYGNVLECSIFLADAFRVQSYANNFKNKKLSKNEILKGSNPFHCFLCCPFGNEFEKYFRKYYPQSIKIMREWEIEYNSNNMPRYVRLLLSREFEASHMKELIMEYELESCRKIATYDMRNSD